MKTGRDDEFKGFFACGTFRQLFTAILAVSKEMELFTLILGNEEGEARTISHGYSQ